MAWIRKNSY